MGLCLATGIVGKLDSCAWKLGSCIYLEASIYSEVALKSLLVTSERDQKVHTKRPYNCITTTVKPNSLDPMNRSALFGKRNETPAAEELFNENGGPRLFVL